MNSTYKKYSISSLIVALCFYSTQALAQTSCTKDMLADLTAATDACLSDRAKFFEHELARFYSSFNSTLPEIGQAASEDEHVGLSQKRVNDLYASWQNYQHQYCSVQASSFGLNKRYEDRAYSICWIEGAQQHLERMTPLTLAE